MIGGGANIAIEDFTNVIAAILTWGMLPFTTSEEDSNYGDERYVYVPNVRDQLFSDSDDYKAHVISGGVKKQKSVTPRSPQR